MSSSSTDDSGGCMLHVKDEFEASSPFEGGQCLALAVLDQAAAAMGPDDAAALMRGLFSGAMAALQASMGTAAVRVLFETLAAADTSGAAPAAGTTPQGMH